MIRALLLFSLVIFSAEFSIAQTSCQDTAMATNARILDLVGTVKIEVFSNAGYDTGNVSVSLASFEVVNTVTELINNNKAEILSSIFSVAGHDSTFAVVRNTVDCEVLFFLLEEGVAKIYAIDIIDKSFMQIHVNQDIHTKLTKL